MRFRFPHRMWKAAMSDSVGAIGFNLAGDKLVINRRRFELSAIGHGDFKNCKMVSVQLQLYNHGFRRCHEPLSPAETDRFGDGLVVYQHPLFLRDQPKLLDELVGRRPRPAETSSSSNGPNKSELEQLLDLSYWPKPFSSASNDNGQLSFVDMIQRQVVDDDSSQFMHANASKQLAQLHYPNTFSAILQSQLQDGQTKWIEQESANSHMNTSSASMVNLAEIPQTSSRHEQSGQLEVAKETEPQEPPILYRRISCDCGVDVEIWEMGPWE